MSQIERTDHPATAHSFRPQILADALQRDPDGLRVVTPTGGLTGRELRAGVSRMAAALATLGIGATHPVAVLSSNRPDLLIAMCAVGVQGCRTTALHPLGSLDDQAYVVEDAEIRTLVFDPAHATRAAELAQRSPGLTLLSLGPAEVGRDLLALTASQPEGPIRPALVRGEDISTIAYTGGTTGKPKGAASNHSAHAAVLQMQMAEWQWPTTIRHLVCTPLSHAGAAFLVPTLLRSGCFVVLPAFDAATVLETIERERITSLMVVPSMLYVLMDHPDFQTRDLSSLQTVFYGASVIAPARLRQAIEALGPIFVQFYGQAECPITIAVLRKEDHDLDRPELFSSCGRPVPWLTIRLLDEQGHEVAPGEAGEICVRGPIVMTGYWNRPDETAEAFSGGWLHTGDIARQSADGFLEIVDRKKDMIVSGGFNVYPREIEDVLIRQPGVSQAAVFAVPHEKWGEAVAAVIVLDHTVQVEADQLARAVKQAKGAHYAPKTIEFVEALPLTAVGKVDKLALRAEKWKGVSRAVN